MNLVIDSDRRKFKVNSKKLIVSQAEGTSEPTAQLLQMANTVHSLLQITKTGKPGETVI